jgi:hypothetical protein
MAGVSATGYPRPIHPLHAILLAFPFSLFLAAPGERRCLLGALCRGGRPFQPWRGSTVSTRSMKTRNSAMKVFRNSAVEPFETCPSSLIKSGVNWM